MFLFLFFLFFTVTLKQLTDENCSINIIMNDDCIPFLCWLTGLECNAAIDNDLATHVRFLLWQVNVSAVKMDTCVATLDAALKVLV